MKNKILIPFLICAAGLAVAASAQEPAAAAPAAPAAAPAAAAAAPAPAAAAPEKKKAAPRAKKSAAKPAVKPAAAVTAAPAQEPAQSTAAPAAQEPQPAAAAAAAPAPQAAAAAKRSSCPNCFEPLIAGYNGILADLKPWMEEMDAQAAAYDAKLSAIQKEINLKDDAIEKAKQDPDKKAGKAAAKLITKERKQLLNSYSGLSDEKDAFYKKFSKEVEKRMKGYNKTVGEKLRMTLSAASD